MNPAPIKVNGEAGLAGVKPEQIEQIINSMLQQQMLQQQMSYEQDSEMVSLHALMFHDVEWMCFLHDVFLTPF